MSSWGDERVRTAAEMKVAFCFMKGAALRTANGVGATLDDLAVLSGRNANRLSERVLRRSLRFATVSQLA